MQRMNRKETKGRLRDHSISAKTLRCLIHRQKTHILAELRSPKDSSWLRSQEITLFLKPQLTLRECFERRLLTRTGAETMTGLRAAESALR